MPRISRQGSGPKSGKERKAKRNARKHAELSAPEVWRPANEHEAMENNALVRKSIRWNTDANGLTFSGKDPRTLKARELALLVTRRNMMAPDPAVANAAVRNLVSMEAMNQRDEVEDKKPSEQLGSVHNHLHLHNASDDQVIELKKLMNSIKTQNTSV